MRILRIVVAALVIAGATERARAEDKPAQPSPQQASPEQPSPQPASPEQASPEALAAANELFSILSIDMVKQLTAQMTNAMWPMLAQRARADNIDDATIEELHQQFIQVQNQNIGDILKDAAPIYARHFTVDELHALTAFYRSPAGVKAAKELPQVMAEFVTVIAPRMQQLQQQSVDGFNKILRDHGYLK
jgi:uncharacterized protein